MNLIYKVLLTLNATFWMIIIYLVKEGETLFTLPVWVFDCILVVIPVLLSALTLVLSKHFGEETIKECQEFSLADNEFLPIYLGYFFVSLSVPNCYTMVAVYLIVFVFTFLSQTQYFNPIFLLFGYHYYHVLTLKGTRVFVIRKGKVIRNKEELCFEHLRRKNDTTFIERR